MQFMTKPVELEEEEVRTEPARALPKSSWWRREKVRSQELLAFTHQLASMLGSGLSFAAAVEILLLPGVHRPATRSMVADVALPTFSVVEPLIANGTPEGSNVSAWL